MMDWTFPSLQFRSLSPFSFLGASGVILFFTFIPLFDKNRVGRANRIALDGTPPFAASNQGLFCMPMSHKRTLGLYGLFS